MEKSKILINNILILIAILAPTLIIPSRICEYNLPKACFLLLCGLLLLLCILVNYKKLKIDKKDVLILIFAGLIYLSTAFSSNFKVSIIGSSNRYEGLLMFITYICIYISSKKFFTWGSRKIFFNAIFYTSFVIGLLGIAQRYVSFVNLRPIFSKGISATFGHSNFFGSYISLVLPVSIICFIINANKKSFILSCIMFFNMIASGTRSTWVSFIIIILLQIIFLIKQKNKAYYKRFFVLTVFFAFIFLYLFSGIEIKDILNKENNVSKSTTQITKNQIEKVKIEIETAKKDGLNKRMGSSRIWIWTLTLKLIKQKPILGCGTDNLKYGLLQYETKDFIDFFNERNEFIDKAHNEYLQIAVTIGIPALIVYLVFLTLILLPKIKLMFKSKMCFILASCLISYLIQAFFNISTIGVAPIFWMILGLGDNMDLLQKIKV